MKRKEAVKINDAFTRFLTKMSQGKIVDVPEGTMFKAGKGIAISENDYNTLYPFLWAAVEKRYTVGGLELKYGTHVCQGVVFTDDCVYVRIPDPESLEFAEAYMDLYLMAKSVIESYRRTPISEIYKEGGTDEGMDSRRSD